jgi:hypothetical protein
MMLLENLHFVKSTFRKKDNHKQEIKKLKNSETIL